MTSPVADRRVPPILVDYDGTWIRVDLRADVDAWAETEVRQRLEAGGQQVKKRDLRRRAGYLATMVRIATRNRDVWGLFLLSPGADGKDAWVFPGYPMAVALTTAFTNLAEAAVWLPALDALAAGVSIDGQP